MHITPVLVLLVVARARRRCSEYSMAMPWCGPRPLRNGTADAMRALARLIGFGDQAAQFEASVGLTNTTDPSGLLVQAALDSALARLTTASIDSA